MALVGLSFHNYKAFPGRERIALRPLTVLIGRNSSGKSAIARLPLLLASSFSERAQAPLDLEIEGVDLGGSFLDLVHNRRPHGHVELGATFERGGKCIEFEARIQDYTDQSLQVVDRWRLRVVGEREWVLKRTSEDPMESPTRFRLDVDGQQTSDTSLDFAGLQIKAPFDERLFSRPQLMELLPWEMAVHMELSDVMYLGPFRDAPRRLNPIPGGLPQDVGRSGKRAAAMLGADARRKGGLIAREVGAWYRDHLGGFVLDVAIQGESFSLVLRSPDDPAVQINLVDAGTGLSQVLPIIVQRIFEARTGKFGSLEISEQPELHLHPAAHGDLADLYITAARDLGVRFLIETHSENFILRMRRRVAEGKLDPRLIAIYWIDDRHRPGSRIVPIEILPDGEVDHWPEGVFSEDFDELIAIRDAQRRRGA